MSVTEKVLERIRRNREKNYNCIPFDKTFARFSDYLPGIERRKYYAITGTPASGKTQFTDYTFLYSTYDFCEANNIPLEIHYFSLEISKEEKIIQGLSKLLFIKEGIKIPVNILDSKGKTRLSDEVHEKVKKISEYCKKLESKVTFYDDQMTPAQIKKIMLDVVKKNGTYDPVKDYYEPNNEDKYIIFIFDHISLITPDNGQTPHSALAEFSRNNVNMRNKFGVTIVNVHQQGIEGSVEQFTNKGDNVVSKLEPKLANLGDNRTLSRDYDIVLGLFSPFRHEVDFYRGYKVRRFGDNCRWLSILKNRNGTPDIHVGLYFDGSVGYFEELPKADQFSVLRNGQKIENQELYEKYEKGKVGPLDSGFNLFGI